MQTPPIAMLAAHDPRLGDISRIGVPVCLPLAFHRFPPGGYAARRIPGVASSSALRPRTMWLIPCACQRCTA